MKNITLKIRKIRYFLYTLLCIVFIAQNAYGQEKMNEKEAMKKSHIDFTKEYIWFEISGLIEIDGHIFKNDTCKCSIIYIANLKEVTITDTCKNIKYEYRRCGKVDCNIIHLQEKQEPQIQFNPQPNWQYFYDDKFNYIPNL
jgi:hypothetical protein